MTSRLASAMLQVPRPTGEVGDVLWRQAEMTSVPFAGCSPTDALFDEFLFILRGEAATNFAAIVPNADKLDSLVTSAVQEFRLGVVKNPLLTDAQLATLTTDTVADVAAAATALQGERTDARAKATGPEPDAVEVVNILDLEGVRQLLASDPELLVTGMIRSHKRNDLLDLLEVLDKSLFDELMLAWTTTEGTPLDVRAANWLCATEVRIDTLLGNVPSATLRRRCTPGATRVFADAGVVTLPAPPKSPAPAYASLETMVLVMPPSELAGMLVGSDSPVSEQVSDKILLKSQPTLVANYMSGMCLRKPQPGEVTRLVSAASADQRVEWGAAIVKQGQESDSLVGPWAGELLLLATMDWLTRLDETGLASLNEVLVERLGDIAAVWEFAMILSEEWEATLFDLLDTAVAMETPDSVEV